MRLKLLESIVRRLHLRIRKQPGLGSQRLLVTEQTIDSVLAKESGDAEELEEFLDSAIQDRIADIEALNETLRGKN
jgi:hypothetical protein